MPEQLDDGQPRRGLWEIVWSRRMLVCALLGFSSGMPLYVLVSLLPAWLRTEGVSLVLIGAFSGVRAPYSWKFVWAPLLDCYPAPGLGRMGRHRGWALGMQFLLLLVIGALGWIKPSQSLAIIAVLAVLVALFSATQDIVVDAYRRELLPDAELGLGNAVFVNTYRIAGLVPGGLALPLADHLPWAAVYWIVAAFMLIGVVALRAP
jgi:MFS transporter, PAT family, beta-lactamase induction signal transducer AmpG